MLKSSAKLKEYHVQLFRYIVSGVPNTWRVENKGSLLTHGYEHGSCFDLEVDETE